MRCVCASVSLCAAPRVPVCLCVRSAGCASPKRLGPDRGDSADAVAASLRRQLPDRLGRQLLLLERLCVPEDREKQPCACVWLCEFVCAIVCFCAKLLLRPPQREREPQQHTLCLVSVALLLHHLVCSEAVAIAAAAKAKNSACLPAACLLACLPGRLSRSSQRESVCSSLGRSSKQPLHRAFNPPVKNGSSSSSDRDDDGSSSSRGRSTYKQPLIRQLSTK